MEEIEIENGNKLIGMFYFGEENWQESLECFSNVQDKVPDWWAIENISGEENDYVKIGELQFHTSWDWLILAIKKWDHLFDPYGTAPDEYIDLCDKLDSKTICYDLFPTWEMFIGCIKWYNELKDSK